MKYSNKQQAVKQIWENAKRHSHAAIVGIPVDLDNYENQLCSCCDQPIRKQQISLWQHTKQFEIFGFGYPLWFSFLKYCIILVLVLITSRTSIQIFLATQENYDFCYGAHNQTHSLTQTKEKSAHHPHEHFLGNQEIIHLRYPQQNHEQNQFSHFGHSQKPKQLNEQSHGQNSGHHAEECTSFMVYLSIFRGQLLYRNQFLKVIAFIVHLVALIGIRNMIQKQQQYYDQRTCSLSDYSLIISNLPPVYGTKGMVLHMLQEQFGMTYGPQGQIKDLIYVFQQEKIEEYKEEKKKLSEQAIHAIQHQEPQKYQKIKQKIHKLDEEQQHLAKALRGDMDRDYVKCDKMIVIMNTQAEKGEVIEDFQQGEQDGKNYNQYFQHVANPNSWKAKISIREAPEPNQIIWQHIDQSDHARKWLICRGWLFTILFLAVITIVFYFILLAKTNFFVHAVQMEHTGEHSKDAKHMKTYATVIVFIALFGVVLFNKFIMGKVLHKFVHMQRHAYTDKQNHSFAMKYALGMFFTTALMTLAVEAITFQNFYKHQYGVIEEQTIMFFVTAFFIPLVWVIHPYNLCKTLSFWDKKDKLVSQDQANELIEWFPYDLGKRYAEIFQIMWFTFLYSQLIPLGSFLMLIGLILYYWVDKYNFLRRSALKSGISGKLPILGLKSLDATLFLAPAGQILFDAVMRNEYQVLPIVLTILGIIYLIIPISDIIWAFNGQKFLLQTKTYDQAKYSFKQHYYTLHPVYRLTHKKQIGEFKKKVRSHYKEQLKKLKMYGAGRGNFVRADNVQHIRSGSLISNKHIGSRISYIAPKTSI